MKKELYIIQNGKLPNCQWYAGQHKIEGKEIAVFTDITSEIFQFKSKKEANKCFEENIQSKPIAFCKQPSRDMFIKKWLDFIHEYMI